MIHAVIRMLGMLIGGVIAAVHIGVIGSIILPMIGPF